MSTNPNTDNIVSKMINKNEDLVDKCIKSQHELNPCNDGKRSSSVLLSTIEELEKTKKQLAIAVKALDSLRGICFPERAEKALKEIEELNNGR